MQTRHLYYLSIIILLSGLTAFSIYVYKKYTSLDDLLIPLQMPGSVEVYVAKPGMYDVYYENASSGDPGPFTKNGDDGPFSFTVSSSAGKEMPVRRVEAIKKYRFRGRSGEAVYEVNIPLADKYILKGAFERTNLKKQFNLYFDMGFSLSRSKTVITAQAILLFPIIASLILFLYAYSKNRVKN